VGKEIEKQQELNASLIKDLKKADSDNRTAKLRQAISLRLLKRLYNFQLQYDTFLADAATECKELDLNASDLVKLTIDSAAVMAIRDQANVTADNSAQEKQRIEGELLAGRTAVAQLTLRLDAPNIEYQKYLKELDEWKHRRASIMGDDNQVGSVNFFQKQLKAIANIPALLNAEIAAREAKLRDIYCELAQLVSDYRALYRPISEFIENHPLTGKFGFGFEAAIVCTGLCEQLLERINQGRKGSFSGTEEGRKLLESLIATADFASESGVIGFVKKLLEHLTHDKRESSNPRVRISDQLRKGATELDLLDTIFSLRWLSPRYSLKWSGKDIEQLSPGERGSLLLIFYLLIDRRDAPLIIDQPEENLDNQTVYELLVPSIKEARKKRQVIIVTHNPNLAVVCDADQVIHCHREKLAKNKVTYISGALESPAINRYTINVLEGTRPAFERRDSKYHE
jgi:hypothetical protein